MKSPALISTMKPDCHPARFFIKLLLMAGIICWAGAPASALDASERAFIWNEAQACLAAAQTPDDFLHAARTYQKLVDDGVHNGALFFNLGTALLQAGQVDQAIDAFQRAERFLGARDDIRRNLAIAMARKADNETAEWPWYRLVLFWHFYLPAATRMIVATSAFLIFWVVLTLRMFGINRSGMNTILILAALTMILFGSSVAVTWQQEATAGGYQLIPAPTAIK